MDPPEFLICLECETPCYVFEWDGREVSEVLCPLCGNEEATEFVTEEDYDALMDEP